MATLKRFDPADSSDESSLALPSPGGKSLPNEHSLVQSLYGALTDREGFHGFLANLVNLINGCAAQLIIVRKNPLQVDHLWYHGLSDEFLDWYLENNMIAQDVVTNQAINQSPGLFQSALPLLPDFQPGEEYSKWETDQDMLDSAWLVVDSTATHTFLLTIQRTVAQGPYQESELQSLNGLVPHIRQAVLLYRQLESRSKAASSLASAIEVLPDATFVLDSFASVLYSNKTARNLLQREQCLRIQQDRFNFVQKDLQAAFLQSSSQVIRSSMGKESCSSETLFLKREGRTPLIFVIRPVESSELLTGGALVTVYDQATRVLPTAEHIATYFKLTPAEGQVCENLIAGMDPQGCADQLGRSVATVRSHLKQIFQKTGCSRQGELISRILLALLH